MIYTKGQQGIVPLHHFKYGHMVYRFKKLWLVYVKQAHLRQYSRKTIMAGKMGITNFKYMNITIMELLKFNVLQKRKKKVFNLLASLTC